MMNIKTVFIALMTLAIYGNPAYAKSNNVDPSIKGDLIKVCEALKSNNKFKLRSAIRKSGITNKAIYEGLVCNGMDAVSFALSVNATETASYLAKDGKLVHYALISKK